MPSPQAFSWPPPRDWQAFEDLCADLWSRLWRDPGTQKHGRSGQSQKGVDIYGQPDQGRDWEAVQCKLKDPLHKRALSRREIEKEISSARKFKPSLRKLVVATTSARDAKLQEAVRLLDKAERQAGSFSVSILFWEDIVLKLSGFPDLVVKHLPHPTQPSSPSLIEIVVNKEEELDYVALLKLYSSPRRKTPDRTALHACLSNIEIINHDTSPTKVRSLRVCLWDPILQEDIAPLEITEENLIGNTQIEARSDRRYSLAFEAHFDHFIPQDGSKLAVLQAETIGTGSIRTVLPNTFWHPAQSKAAKHRKSIKKSP
jgi:hypothetical protein